MPIFSVNNPKYLCTNEDKTKNVIIEFQKELTLNELLERIDEIRETIIKTMKEENNKKEEKMPES